MSSESSSFSAGGGVAAAVLRTSGNSTPSPAGVPCPPQLSLEAIASFPPELPPLDDSRMAPAVAAAAAALRARFTTASSNAQALMLAMREFWEMWNLLPILPSGTRAALLCAAAALPRRVTELSLTLPAPPLPQLSQQVAPCQPAPPLPPPIPHRTFLPTKLKCRAQKSTRSGRSFATWRRCSQQPAPTLPPILFRLCPFPPPSQPPSTTPHAWRSAPPAATSPTWRLCSTAMQSLSASLPKLSCLLCMQSMHPHSQRKSLTLTQKS